MEKRTVILRYHRHNDNLSYEYDQKTKAITNWKEYVDDRGRILDPDKFKDKEITIEGEVIEGKGKSKSRFKILALIIEDTSYRRSVRPSVKKLRNVVNIGDATAPYNFVPLNDKVVPSDNAATGFGCFASGLISGVISLSIKNLSPFFIRDGSESMDFFNISEVPHIPGSGLRGLVRSIYEIITFSEIGYVDRSRQLFYRNISDKFYLQRALSPDQYHLNNILHREVKPKSLPGWIIRKGSKYVIIPAQTIEGQSYFRINASVNEGNNTVSLGGKTFSPLHHCDIYIRPETKDYIHKKGRMNLVYHPLIREYSYRPKSELVKAHLVISGLFSNTKHFQWVIGGPGTEEVSISQDIITKYRDDDNRETSYDLLKLCQKQAHPCFYHMDKGEVTSFGHTPLYRLPYDLTIGDAIQQERDPLKPDMTSVVFGTGALRQKATTGTKDKGRASKVSFGDCQMTEYGPNEQYSPRQIKVLNSPKPTTFQHYLDQSDVVGDKPKDLNNWNTKGAKIRGHKLYWHRQTEQATGEHNWALSEAPPNPQLYPEKVKAIAPGATFHGEITFENLSRVELGALLYIVQLPEPYKLKIGLGKSLGLGTIEVAGEVDVIDRSDRYSTVLTSDGWHTAKSKAVDNYVSSFITYMDKALGQSFEKHPRIVELLTLLSFDKELVESDRWLEGTRYMEIERVKNNGRKDNEYKNRPKLSRPSEILKYHKSRR